MNISALNLVTLREGEGIKAAFDHMVGLAQDLEALGYKRYWLAEHHNTSSIASSATDLLIQAVLSKTHSIRVGSGGIMLPNHSPYLLAESFGTLETLYPGRVDLGLGRAPGTDPLTARAIRRQLGEEGNFQEQILELQSYFRGEGTVSPYPGTGLEIPLYILGSSVESARLAAHLGLPYVFAGHFTSKSVQDALETYRREFKASAQLQDPYAILCLNVLVAESNQQARMLATTQLDYFLGILTSRPRKLRPPLDKEEEVWKAYVAAEKVPHFGPLAFKKENIIHQERAAIKRMTKLSLIGSQAAVAQQIADLRATVPFDELLANSFIYDSDKERASFQLLADCFKN